MGSPVVSYFYDQTSHNGLTIANGKGQRTGMSDASGITWSFDITAGTGWKSTERRTLNGVTKTVVSQSNLSGAVTQLTNPSGTVITYGTDTAGRITSASDATNTYVQSATYAAHGALETLANGAGGAINWPGKRGWKSCTRWIRIRRQCRCGTGGAPASRRR